VDCGEPAADERVAQFARQVRTAYVRVGVVDVDDPPSQSGALDNRTSRLDLG
jgi:hypothetical protein